MKRSPYFVISRPHMMVSYKNNRDCRRTHRSFLACWQGCCPFAQPDYETRHQRIRALFARVTSEKIAPRAYWRMPRPQFFKLCRRLAASLIESKSHFTTTTYAWRTKRYSNCRSGWAIFPFEMSAEFRANRGKLATREKLA